MSTTNPSGQPTTFRATLRLTPAEVVLAATVLRPSAETAAEREDLRAAARRLSRLPSVETSIVGEWERLTLDGHEVSVQVVPGIGAALWHCTCGRPGGRRSCIHEWAMRLAQSVMCARMDAWLDPFAPPPADRQERRRRR